MAEGQEALPEADMQQPERWLQKKYTWLFQMH